MRKCAKYLIICFRIVSITILLLVFSLASISCNKCGYTKYIREKGEPQFSFEYPKCYMRGGPENMSRGAVIDLAQYFGMGVIYDLTIEISSQPPDAQNVLVNYITKYQDNTDYKVLERSLVIIDNQEQNMTVFSYYDNEFGVITKKLVIFDYHGWVIKMDAASSEKYEKENRTVFDHILQTFKILD
jgi:hypothetical protein